MLTKIIVLSEQPQRKQKLNKQRLKFCLHKTHFFDVLIFHNVIQTKVFLGVQTYEKFNKSIYTLYFVDLGFGICILMVFRFELKVNVVVF